MRDTRTPQAISQATVRPHNSRTPHVISQATVKADRHEATLPRNYCMQTCYATYAMSNGKRCTPRLRGKFLRVCPPLDPTTHALLTWFQNEMLCDRRLNPCTLRPISKGADTRYRRHNARVLSWFYRVMACSEIQAPKYNEKNQSPLGRLEPGTLELRHERFKARLHLAWSETHAV